ncbi:hypothetical protein CDO25_30595 (plasmid) [Sinorhizobium meliloti]|nr:hypothetical protein CDO25_30595 [Sinorhizobium meliloti]
MLARTETMMALGSARDEAMRQQIEAGAIIPTSVSAQTRAETQLQKASARPSRSTFWAIFLPEMRPTIRTKAT